MPVKKRSGGSSADSLDLAKMVESSPQGAYEALQLYRSRATRLKVKNDLNNSIMVIIQGVKCLLKNSYENAGSELSMLLLDFLNEFNKEVDTELKQTISEIEQSFPQSSPHRVEFLKGCVKWSIKCGSRELGDPYLHVALGKCLWDMQDKASVYHFAAGEAPEQYCQKLDDTYGSETDQDKRDQYFTLGVVHFLALENLRDANELLVLYRKAQKKRGFTSETDLFTFNKYLLLTCRRDAQPLFKTLVNQYARALDFDDNVPALLTGPIGLKFFKIQPKANPMMSMLQQMVR